MNTIVTARLTLRPITGDDAGLLHAIWIDPAVRRYLWDDVVIPPERAAEMVEAMVAGARRNGRGLWLVYERDSTDAAGFAGFLPRADAGQGTLIYGLLPRSWRRGYATESARAVCDYGFGTLGLEKIVASVDVPNAASIRVLERLGMQFVKREVVHGIDLLFYEISVNHQASINSQHPTPNSQ
jgi:ribosomal-protein-alanine N-acetyltransferase